MKDLLRKAIEGIKKHPTCFLYDEDVQRAFRELRHRQGNVLSVSVPAASLGDISRLKMLPIPAEAAGDRIKFPWFPMGQDIGTVAAEFVDSLVHALDCLPNRAIPTKDETDRIKEEYKPGTKVRIKHMIDVHAPEDGTVDVVAFVDDMGQVHLRGCPPALIPGIDEFEPVH